MQPNESQAQPYPTSGQMAHGDPSAYGQTSPTPYGSISPAPYDQTSPPQGQTPYPPAPFGQTPHARPQGAQPPGRYGQQQPPPYAQAPPPYLQQTDAARVAKQQKGKRDVAFGVVWLVAGLLITAITMGSASPVYIVAWGPMLYGLYKIIKGMMAISDSKG